MYRESIVDDLIVEKKYSNRKLLIEHLMAKTEPVVSGKMRLNMGKHQHYCNFLGRNETFPLKQPRLTFVSIRAFGKPENGCLQEVLSKKLGSLKKNFVP